MKKINLAFAQDITEANYIMENSKHNIVWVPLNLETMMYFEQKKINYINPNKLLNNHFHKKGLEQWSKLEKKLIKIMLLEESLKYRYKGIIRKFFNSIFFLIEVISKIEKKYKINSLVLSGWNNYNQKSIKDNYICSKILNDLYKRKFNIILIDEIKDNFNHQVSELDYRIQNTKKKKILFTDLNYNFLRIIYSCLFNKNLAIYILDLHSKKSLRKFFLKLAGVRFISVYNSIKKKQKKFKLALGEISYKYKNFDLSDLIKYRGFQIKKNLSEIKLKNEVLDKVYKYLKPNLTILNNVRGNNFYITKLGKKYNLNTMILSHGTLSQGDNKFEKMYQKIIAEELINKYAKYLCLQNKILERSLKTIEASNKFIKTGNIIFSEAKQNRKSFFLYAVTQRDFVNMQFYGIETFYEFYENLNFLNNLAKKYNYRFLVKLHPNINKTIKPLKKKFLNLKFTNKSIQKLLSETIATISFSSTAIDDSLSSGVPVILLDRVNRYSHDSTQKNNKLENKAVFYCNNKSDFIKKLEHATSKNDFNFNYYSYGGNYKDNIKENILNFIK